MSDGPSDRAPSSPGKRVPPAELRPRLSAEERRHWIRRGVDDFDAGRYYDCHEAFEVVWRSDRPEPRDLFRGLIQVAVGFFHFFERGRPDVALRVLRRGRARVEPHGPECLGLDLGAFVASLDPWESWLEGRARGGGRPDPPPPRPRLGGLAGPVGPGGRRLEG